MTSFGKLMRVLNEPFMLWLFSSVVVGFVSWQYSEIQKVSMERDADAQVVRRAKLEIDLQLRDIQFNVGTGEDMTASHLNATWMLLRYNAASEGSGFYFPAIPNLMLELDARTGSCGLAKFKDRVYDHATGLSSVWIELTNTSDPYSSPLSPTQRIYERLSAETLVELGKLVDLAREVQEYYARSESRCESA